MTNLNRSSLKDKFKKGAMPSENDFGNLIDAMVNIVDDGFKRTDEHGVKIKQLMNSGNKLMSFYENLTDGEPRWFMELGEGDNKLHFGTRDTPYVLSLRNYEEQESGDATSRVAIGINKELPRATLDVDGTIASSGRCGQPGEQEVLADGEWHDITESLTGCEIFEVVAGVGGKDGEGKYALLRATALNTFNGKGSIEQQSAHYGNKCNRIELRWANAPESQFHYKLQLRVQCAYFQGNEKIWVKYYITRLWFDPLMLNSQSKF